MSTTPTPAPTRPQPTVVVVETEYTVAAFGPFPDGLTAEAWVRSDLQANDPEGLDAGLYEFATLNGYGTVEDEEGMLRYAIAPLDTPPTPGTGTPALGATRTPTP